MHLITIQPTSPQVTILAPNLPPVPTHAAEIPRRPGHDRGSGAGSVIRERRLSQERLHDAVRGCGRDIRPQQGVVIVLGFDETFWGRFLVFCFGLLRLVLWLVLLLLRRRLFGGHGRCTHGGRSFLLLLFCGRFRGCAASEGGGGR